MRLKEPWWSAGEIWSNASWLDDVTARCRKDGCWATSCSKASIWLKPDKNTRWCLTRDTTEHDSLREQAGDTARLASALPVGSLPVEGDVCSTGHGVTFSACTWASASGFGVPVKSSLHWLLLHPSWATCGFQGETSKLVSGCTVNEVRKCSASCGAAYNTSVCTEARSGIEFTCTKRVDGCFDCSGWHMGLSCSKWTSAKFCWSASVDGRSFHGFQGDNKALACVTKSWKALEVSSPILMHKTSEKATVFTLGLSPLGHWLPLSTLEPSLRKTGWGMIALAMCVAGQMVEPELVWGGKVPTSQARWNAASFACHSDTKLGSWRTPCVHFGMHPETLTACEKGLWAIDSITVFTRPSQTP